MPTDDPDLEIPELTPEWFRTAVRPHHDVAVADGFQSDEDREGALRALLEAADHIRRTR